MAYSNPSYRGDAVKQTRHDQLDFDMTTEQKGVGNEGQSRNNFDAGVASKGKLVKAKAHADTSGIAFGPYDGVDEINPSKWA